MNRMGRSHGLTLLEMIVVLAVLGVILGVSGLALASLRAPRDSERIRALRYARSEAIRTGRATRFVATCSVLPAPCASVLFLPDGRALGPGVDPLTGAPRDSAR